MRDLTPVLQCGTSAVWLLRTDWWLDIRMYPSYELCMKNRILPQRKRCQSHHPRAAHNAMEMNYFLPACRANEPSAFERESLGLASSEQARVEQLSILAKLRVS